MDRVTYDPTSTRRRSSTGRCARSADLIARWHGADDGRLRYAVTPRFAVSCTAELLRESAALAASTGAYWQTHVSEDRGEIAEVARLFPEALDYVDVYDRAGGLGRADRAGPRRAPVGSRAGTARRDRHARRALPGVEPVPRVGGDAAGAIPGGGAVRRARLGRGRRPGPVDLHGDAGRRSTPRTRCASAGLAGGAGARRRSTGSGWARSTARGRSGSTTAIGSLEAGKEADLIAVDPSFVAPCRAAGRDDDPEDLASRLIFRAHPDMVRGAWVRGRRLEGPAAPRPTGP